MICNVPKRRRIDGRVLAAACLSLVLASPALAQEARTVRVSYGDLNLASPQGKATLNRRTEQAIANVCGDNGTRDLASQMMARRCRNNVRTNVAQQIAAIDDRPQQTALNVGGPKSAAR